MKTRSFPIVLLVLLLAIPAAAQRRRPGGAPHPNNPDPNPTSNAMPAAGDPLAGLTTAQRDEFADGLEDFTEEEAVDEGLGPVFNERSCTACHSVPAVGGGSTRLVTRFARTVNGAFDACDILGGTLMQDHAIGPADGSPHAFAAETVPAVATIVVHRRSVPLFGLGLVDATPDADFVALAASQNAAKRDGVAGRVNMVDNIRAGMKTVGKFGWKSQVPSLLQFAGDAYLNELGITNADFPNENCPQGNCAELAFNPAPGINDDGSGIAALHDFMAMLAPAPRAQNRDANEGEGVFERIGCNACHVATMRTGPNAIAALDRKTYHPYSDFLLHDMGSLGDGIPMGQSTGTEMRTAPLWGLRFVTTYLHDGRATTLEQAVLAHDGQARASRDRFSSLNRDQKGKLLAFLQSL